MCIWSLFLICLFTFPDQNPTFKGNLSYGSGFFSTSNNQNNDISFQINYNNSLCPTCSQLILNSKEDTNYRQVYYIGKFTSNFSSFFYIGYVGDIKDAENIIKVINDSLVLLNKTEPDDHYALRKMISQTQKQNLRVIYKIISFNISEGKQNFSMFYSNTMAKGEIFINTRLERKQDPLMDFVIYKNFTAFQFDEYKFIFSGKMLGILASIGVYISYLAWVKLEEYFDTNSKLMQLSVHSFILHVVFDFSYGVLLFNLADINSHLTLLFTMIFGLIMILYFFFETRLLSEIWRASIGDIDIEMQQPVFLDFFLEITIAIFVYNGTMSYIFKKPFICVTLLYSFFIPQIIHSAKTFSRKSHDTFFNLTISLARLLPLYYFSLYKPNIMESYSPSVAIYGTLYVGIQNLIILLQNRFGGGFFVPKPFHPIPFDYQAGQVEPGTECLICLSQIEPNEETMVTPCHHCFHKDCLERWMDVQLICPVCRATLPIVDGFDRSSHQPQDAVPLL